MMNDTYGEITRDELNALRAKAHTCITCGMLADVDPVLHHERYAHRPRYRDNNGTLKIWNGHQFATVPTL